MGPKGVFDLSLVRDLPSVITGAEKMTIGKIASPAHFGVICLTISKA